MVQPKEIPKSPTVSTKTPAATSPKFETPPEKPRVSPSKVEKRILPQRDRKPPECFGYDH